MEKVLIALLVAGFGYFLYTRIRNARDRDDDEGDGGGGGTELPGNYPER